MEKLSDDIRQSHGCICTAYLNIPGTTYGSILATTSKINWEIDSVYDGMMME